MPDNVTNEALSIPGVAMLVEQGNLDHWFDASLWHGGPGSISPSQKAFDKAVAVGLLEKHAVNNRYRLTNLGRACRSSASQVQA